jgi:hypothetical protein
LFFLNFAILFSNINPCYVDHNQSWGDALPINGSFIHQIAEQAKKLNCYIVLSVTLRRDISRDLPNNKQDGSIKSNISVTSCLISPLDGFIHQVEM